MILRPQLSHVLLSLFIFSSFTAAWPWPPSFSDIEGLILRRADDPKSDTTSASKAESGTDASKPTKTPSPVSRSGKGSATATTGAKAKGSGTSTGDAAQITDVDPRLPAGGVNMITPSLLQTTYYKIGDTVEFAWNYTSLSVKPSKVDIIVTCTANSATYTLSSNASFESTGRIYWDTKPDMSGTAPLLTETYSLIVHDAAKDISASPEAGHLGTNQQFQFGMYLPQSYTPRLQWKCSECNSALSDTERQALKFMFGMCMVTVLSFTWFVGGFGALL